MADIRYSVKDNRDNEVNDDDACDDDDVDDDDDDDEDSFVVIDDDNDDDDDDDEDDGDKVRKMIYKAGLHAVLCALTFGK